jgi:ornithine cyclodeaminase/alanine dehydrogenase-like protein (mu-crystallin family)
MPLVLTDADVRTLFDWRSAIAELRKAYALPYSPAMFPPRTMARGDGLWLRTLSGVNPHAGLMGAKLIAASIRNRRASYLISLFDQESTQLVALIDGASITGFRTAATSALAADALAPARPLAVGVIGSGFEARMHLRALSSIRQMTGVRVFSPNPASRERFAQELADTGVPIASAASGRAAAAGADLVICAARSRDESPTLMGDWLEATATVISIGSTLPEQREIDTSVVARASVIVADVVEEVAHDTGDMLAARRAGIDFEPRLIALADVVADPTRVRNYEGLRIYKSVGAALQDLTIAAMCVARARERSFGTELPAAIAPVLK